MKSLKQFAILMSLVFVSGLAQAANPFVAGKDYVVLEFSQPVGTGAKIEVREFFWYGCPHCFRLEPHIEAWLKTMPKNAGFVRTAMVTANWRLHAQAFYTFEKMGLAAKLHRPFFDAIHVEGKRMDSQEAIADFVAGRGVDRAKFIKAFRSFPVRVKMSRADKDGDAYNLRGVPVLIVDGKYRTSPSMAGSEARVMQVVNFLVKKAARERRRKK